MLSDLQAALKTADSQLILSAMQQLYWCYTAIGLDCNRPNGTSE